MNANIKLALKNALTPDQWEGLREVYFWARRRRDLWIVKSFRKNYLPKFIIIGFPKCGTTALMRNLLKHPDISGLENEPRFFTEKHKSLLEYAKQFDPNRINGEKTSIYVLQSDFMKRVHETIPSAKIIICVRDPVRAMHSFYAHRKNSQIFGKSYGEEAGRINFERLVLNDLNHELFSNQTYCYFKHIKENVLRYFNKKNIYVVVQERMNKNADDEINKVFKFLGVRPHHDQWIAFKTSDQSGKYGSINYGTKDYGEAVKKLSRIYGPCNKQLFDFLGQEIEEWKVQDGKDND